MMPARLAPNLVDHFYAGGARIAALRGIATSSTHQPEEWLGATVARADDNVVGLSSTEAGALLRDQVASDPHAWRGFGEWPGIADSDTGLLLKLLDAGQRLPVHVHPDRAFAATHLACPYGKTEAWYVLDADPDAAVYLGWREDVDPDEVARRRDDQDGDWMLDRMHRIGVRPGDGILVPSGQVHAIGAGVFIAETQEPTDFSILLEWSVTTQGREDSHLGLGFDRAMAAVSHAALSTSRAGGAGAPRARRDLGAPLRPCLPTAADHYFRLHRATAGASVPAGFAVLLVLEGSGRLSGVGHVEIGRGEAWVVPAAYGDWSVAGDLTVLVARPGADWPRDLGGLR